MVTLDQRREIVAAVEEDKERGLSTAEACRKNGVAEGSFYFYRKSLGGSTEPRTISVAASGKSTGGDRLDAELQRLREENAKLRRFVGDYLINQMLEEMPNE